ncbi:MAG TPA: zf-HC2 domain-containing protein [Longimicrobiales bacterium]
MIQHPAEETLHSLVDGELSPAPAVEVERHLQDCGACRDVVAKLESLRRAAARLPREIEPPSHVESAIRAELSRISPAPAVPAARSRGWQRHYAPWIGIAAAIVCVIAGVLYVQQARPRDAATVATADPDVELLSALENELERRRHLLSPETVVVVEENLRTIDEAINATRTALERDPSNPQLASMLEDTQRRRSDYIRTALDLASDL